MAPSSDWREQIDGDEEQRFTGYAERIAALQKLKSNASATGARSIASSSSACARGSRCCPTCRRTRSRGCSPRRARTTP